MADIRQRPQYYARNIAWDIVEPCSDVPRMLAKMNLLPASEEGNEIEHDRSHERVNQTAPISSVTDVLCGMAAAAITAVIIDEQDEDDYDESTAELMFRNMAISKSSVTAVLSSLIDMGLIQISEEVFE